MSAAEAPHIHNLWFSRKSIFKTNELIDCSAITWDGSLVLTGGRNGFLRVWDAIRGIEISTISVGSPISQIALLEISKRREIFLVGCKDGLLRLYWRPTTSYLSQLLRTIGLPSAVWFQPFRFALETNLKGRIESIAYSKTTVAVASENLCIYSLKTRLTGVLASSIRFELDLVGEQVLNRHLIGGGSRSEKRPNFVYFLHDNLLLATFVDCRPSGLETIISTFQIFPWTVIKVVECNRRAGSLAVNPMGNVLAMNNLSDGVDILSVPHLSYLGTILKKVDHLHNFIQGLTFISQTCVVVSGSSSLCVADVSALQIVSSLSECKISDTFPTLARRLILSFSVSPNRRGYLLSQALAWFIFGTGKTFVRFAIV
ncbi:hypothetical protein CPB83DRAFT_891897 [Crepidotus variabilis]|uniref:Uncharacterized protein n=1 Tax=Crepidotus variabilis TaxID=179855 RepID=A0A9P6EKP4_9AGAR|nr:hypothetical protein CPB83DRAFT_891897 [Crepidotus variabilis]